VVMRSGTGKPWRQVDRGDEPHDDDLPAPTLRFRHESWRAFQKALDPLARPRPLPTQRQK